MALADRLADYVLSVRYSDLDPGTIKEMKVRMIDAVGCALGAFDEEPVAIARRTVKGLRGGGGSTLVGTASTSSPELATFLNGLMIRYFDFNDTYLSKEPAHPSDNLAPVFAVAEAEGLGGKEAITAAVAAYEVQCRLCDAADIRHRGWDHVNYGLPSSALAASKLMGLDAKRGAHAVNIALNGHVAMRQVRAGELSMWKGASFANAARNGVFAAMLARNGMTGPSPIFEGEMGFFKQVSGPFKMDTNAFGGKRGEFMVNRTYVKYWPVEYHAQTAVWAALDVKKRIRSGDIRSILVETHEAGYTILAKDEEKWAPQTKESADHSLPYIVAMALLHGKVDNDSYSPRNLKERRNLRMVKLVEVREDPGLTALYPDKGMANRTTIVTANGARVTSQVDVPLGHPTNPMSREAIESKFMGLAGRTLGERRAKEALRAMWEIDARKDLGDVFTLLKVRRGDQGFKEKEGRGSQ